MRIIFIFIDGFGLGEKDRAKNPIYAADAPNIRHILEDCTMYPTDASLGVPGLPQSATGQTAIFTGENGAKALGRHLHGQPTVTLKKMIYDTNLFKTLLSKGRTVTNANVYRQEYLEKLPEPKDRRYRPSVTSVMMLANSLQFRTVDALNDGNGVYHDITGQLLGDSGIEIATVSPEEAARRLYKVSRDYDFTLFEHFMSDIIGHKMDRGEAVKEITLLDTFLGELLKLLDFDRDMLIITSDHGNIEDISIKTHTMNKVPTVFVGKIPQGVDINVQSLLDIMPAVVKLMED